MKRVSLAIASLLPLSAAGYEVGTHALATKVAYDQSVLSPTHPKSIVTALLLDREDVVAPFRMEGVSLPDRYLDIPPLANPIPAPAIPIFYVRNAHRYEGQLFEPPREPRRLVGVSHAAMASSVCCR
jgi:hypothetical protein